MSKTEDQPKDLCSELDIDRESIGKRDRHDYRVVMYDRLQVEYLEKQAIAKMLLDKELYSTYSSTFLTKAALLFPEKFPENLTKKKRGKKSTNYFIEDVGKWLWMQWKESGSSDHRNDFLTYCYPLIDGVIFKYQRHKHGLPYEEIFQSAILKIVQAMDKFDPKRVVGTDDNGNPIYARVFTFFVMILNYGITTITMTHGAERITNVSLDSGMSQYYNAETSAMSDAPIIYQEFLVFLNTVLSMDDEIVTESNKKVLSALQKMLVTHKNLNKLVNNLVVTLKNESGLKIKDVQEALEIVRTIYGPLNIWSDTVKPKEASADLD